MFKRLKRRYAAWRLRRKREALMAEWDRRSRDPNDLMYIDWSDD